jgi:hypothetical protein
MSALIRTGLLATLLLALHVSAALAAELPSISSPVPVILGEPPVAPNVVAVPRAAFSIQALPPAGLVINTQDREAVRTFYRGIFFQSEDVPMGWSGNYATGDAGTTAQPFRDAVALRINGFRALAGVPANISFSNTFNLKDQQAALMMSANGQLSHTPPATWIYYTAAGAEAAGSSNISLGASGADAVTGQLRDPGASNAPVGHRRWLLYPQTRTMGSGDVPGGLLNNAPVLSANAVWVFDGNFGTLRPATRDGFVAWPPKGYAPYPVVYGRWSLSYPNADFSAATVTISKGGTAIPVTVEYRSDTAGPNFGENTIVWFLNGFSDSSDRPRPAADESYLVTISGVLGAGVPATFSYTVVVFDPDVITPGAPLTTVTAPATANTAVAFNGTVAAMPAATGYQLDLHRSSTLTGALTPGNSAAFWTQVTSGYNAIETTEFHLYHAAFETQQLALGKTLYVGQNASLTFDRRFNFATATEIARVQVSLDGGVSWQDVRTEAGTGGIVPNATVTVNLAAFTGRMIRLRFSFTSTGSVFNCATCGWYFKNLVFSNVSELALTSHAVLPSTTLSTSVVAADPGNYILLARTEYQGSYFGDWGPGLAITVTVGSLSAPTAVSATATGAGSITVSYAAPTTTGGSAITGYTAACTSSNGGVSASNTGGAAATSIRVNGLTSGKTYTCTVRASNAAGPGPASALSGAVTPFDITPILNLLLDD